MNITRGQTKIGIIPIKRFNGFSSDITFIHTSPQGVSVTLNPTTLDASGKELEVVIHVPTSAPLGEGEVSITGIPPARNISARIPVNVVDIAAVPTPSTTTTTTSTTTTQAPTTTTTTTRHVTSTLSISSEYLSGRSYRFTANAWVDSGTILDYSWTFGDGNIGYGQSVSHAYAQNGTYTVSVTARFSNGSSNTAYSTVNINFNTTTKTTTTTRAPVVYRELTVQRLVRSSVDNVYRKLLDGIEYPTPLVTQPSGGSTYITYKLSLDESSLTYIYFTNLFDIPEGYTLKKAELILPVTVMKPMFTFPSDTSDTYIKAAYRRTLDINLRKAVAGNNPTVFGRDASLNGPIVTKLPFMSVGFGTNDIKLDPDAIKTHVIELPKDVEAYTSGIGFSISTVWMGSTSQLQAFKISTFANPTEIGIDTYNTKIRLTFTES